jgi:hypothetical protein
MAFSLVNGHCVPSDRMCRSSNAGIVTSSGKLRFLWRPGSQKDEENQLQRLPVPTRDHSAGDLALVWSKN